MKPHQAFAKSQMSVCHPGESLVLSSRCLSLLSETDFGPLLSCPPEAPLHYTDIRTSASLFVGIWKVYLYHFVICCVLR